MRRLLRQQRQHYFLLHPSHPQPLGSEDEDNG
jgi:hypothetical protein